MYKKLIGFLFSLFVSDWSAASQLLYTQQIIIPNTTGDLHINPSQKEMTPMGPTDATVIDNTFVLLDTYGSGVVFFNEKGGFLKRIALPQNAEFDRIIRDRDNSLFVLGTLHDSNSKQAMIVHIQNEVVTEKAILNIREKDIVQITPDDYGLFMGRIEEHFDRKKLNEVSEDCDDCLVKALDEMNVYIQDRISRDCISCEPKSIDGAKIDGLSYRIIQGENQSLSIGNKEFPLVFYSQHKSRYSKIIQVDKEGNVWIENYINLNRHNAVTYVWKLNKLGTVDAIYRFAADTEEDSTLWPTKNDVMVSNYGEVYAMSSDKDQIKFIRLKAFSLKKMQSLAQELDPVLMLKGQEKSKIPQEKLTTLNLDELITGVCQKRVKVIHNAVDYLNNKLYLSTASIKNDVKCQNRIIPPYLVENKEKEGSYESVSYNWGGFDTIANYNSKILTNKLKAGNVNQKQSPLLSCAAGVDCSGLISRVWGLASKLGTYDIENDKITEEISYWEMKPGDVYVKGGDHVMMYKRSSWGIVTVIESNGAYGRVVETKRPAKELEKNFKLRRPRTNIICKE